MKIIPLNKLFCIENLIKMESNEDFITLFNIYLIIIQYNFWSYKFNLIMKITLYSTNSFVRKVNQNDVKWQLYYIKQSLDVILI